MPRLYSNNSVWRQIKNWISASRPRTLPLSFSCITMGAFLSASIGFFSWKIYALSLLTSFFLQILSNLANDYGDYVHGVDHAERVGPKRAVQSGWISKRDMKKSLLVVAFLCLMSGTLLLLISLKTNTRGIFFFLVLGVLSILAALAYTMGSKPYGYVGLGDLFVFIFFGPVGVFGSLYLFTQQVVWSSLWPAVSCGALSVAVLNINNIRDITSDRQAGKYSIPVRWGEKNAVIYHWLLLCIGFFSLLIYTLMHYRAITQLLFFISAPLLIANGILVAKKSSQELNVVLRQMVVTTLVLVISFGVGMLW